MNTSKKQDQPELRVNAPPTDSDIHSHLEISSDEQVTNFIDETPKENVVVKKESTEEEPNPIPSQLIFDILSRPRIVYNFKWTTGQAVGTRVARLSFPDLLFSSPTIWNKVQQYAYLHAGLKFAVRANGTAYHYGQLLFVWRAACLERTLFTASTLPSSYDSLYSMSQRPHMLVSPSSAQLVELEVPYQVPMNRIPISAYNSTFATKPERSFSNLGVLEIWVLTPLRAMGETNDPPVTVNLFASFTNPSLSGYTHQSFTYLSQSIPAVTPLPIPGTLRYTKQITQAKSSPSVSQTPIVYSPAKIHTSTYSQPSALLSLNENDTSCLSSFRLSEALNVWSLFTQFSIAGNAENNALLLAFPVNPSNCMIGTYNSKTLFHHTLLSYIACMFNLWRGPIEYRFDFIASKFHSARVKIAWYPPNTTSLAGYSEMGDEWTKVVDVQGQISETFTAPFIEPVSYLPNDVYAGDRMMNGTIVVSLLNAISYPSSQIPAMSVNVWVRAPNISFSAFTDVGVISNSLLPGRAPVAGPEFFTTSPLTASVDTTSDESDVIFPSSSSVSSTTDSSGKKISAQKHVTQAKVETTVTSVDLDTLVFKPTLYFRIFSGEKFFISPPMLEQLPANTVSATIGAVRMNSLLDWLAAMTLGYTGPVRFSLINPESAIYVLPRSYRGYNATREVNTNKTNPLKVMEDTRWAASAYFPAGINVLKDYMLPCYSSLVYRPFTLTNLQRITTFPLLQPALDLYCFGPEASHVLVAAGDGFSFFGLATAPVTF